MKDLTKKELFYYILFVNYCKNNNVDKASSLEVKLDYDIRNDGYNLFFTKDITEYLTKVSKKGILVKIKTDYLVFFKLKPKP